MTFTFVGGCVRDQSGQGDTLFLLMQCGGCRKCVLCQMRASSRIVINSVQSTNSDLEAAGLQLVDTWPKAKAVEAPENVPENIARFYKQAMAALARGDWDASGIMARKALDTATLKLDSQLVAGSPLVKRIDALAEKHLITPQLREWAHAIRRSGNEAAHDPEEYSDKEAKEICEFTETFLEYVFTMPGKLMLRKAELEKLKNGT